jgi:REP element-mobilizing transposase RayT
MSEIFNINLFSERFRIDAARLKYWDYSNVGCYFITICTRNRINYFGKIMNKKMILSDIGIIAEKYWREMPQHFHNIKLDQFVIMPNHVHGIIHITEYFHPIIVDYSDKYIDYNNRNDHNIVNATNIVETLHCNVSTKNDKNRNVFTDKNNCTEKNMSKISPHAGSIPIIIRSYKSICTREINKSLNNTRYFHWQSRYYDRVIRNEIELIIIRKYIKNNPQNWKFDRNNI